MFGIFVKCAPVSFLDGQPSNAIDVIVLYFSCVSMPGNINVKTEIEKERAGEKGRGRENGVEQNA